MENHYPRNMFSARILIQLCTHATLYELLHFFQEGLPCMLYKN